jgi:hypothetical protein
MNILCLYPKGCYDNDNCPKSGCGLESILSMTEKDLENCSLEDKRLINQFREKYLSAWNSNINSRARGAATGRALEDWIRELLRNVGAKCEKGRLEFQFGKFNVDIIIPNKLNPSALLEVKVTTDRQHALMFSGLINQTLNKTIKFGLVTLYRPSDDIINILEQWKKDNAGRFDYFILEERWNKSYNRLQGFLEEDI